MSAFEELQVAIHEVAERVGPAVVGIGSHQRGSGVVVGDGTVVTNAHNLRGDEVTVTFADGRRTRGRVAGGDVDGDLAVIAVDGRNPFGRQFVGRLAAALACYA